MNEQDFIGMLKSMVGVGKAIQEDPAIAPYVKKKESNVSYVVMVSMVNGGDPTDFPIRSFQMEHDAKKLAEKIDAAIDKVSRGLAKQNKKKQAARKKVWGVITRQPNDYAEPFHAYVIESDHDFESKLNATMAEFEALK